MPSDAPLPLPFNPNPNHIPGGRPPTSSSFGQAAIHDHHLFDFQLVASDYTDCLLRYTSLSYISSQKAGHNTCHLQVHQQLTLIGPNPHTSSAVLVLTLRVCS